MPAPPAHSQWTRPLLAGAAQQPQLHSTSQHSAREHEPARIKVVLVGDGAVGKTSLIVSYSTNGFPPEYEPTAFDNYNVVVNVDGQPINIQLCDTAGQDDFDPLRSLCYPDTDVFLICFSVVSPTSYHSVATKWINEVNGHCPNTPVILVGTKSDLRSDVRLALQLARYGQAPITTTQGHQLANRIGATSYVETSALTQEDLKEAFDQAIVSALSMRRGGLKFRSNRRKPLSLWRRWLCCWERSSTSSSRA
ncbi:PREDICTED: rho-related protein racB-like [Ceratosolen solmsi marchali]|uniref:Rho-related protein racB-like n=1 Tax=Ceratosolen solmsi marchali TaxID=326594 RepID=A0AAJ6YJ93_9HYME|nr:PREDICTED: rho-related protein racB-like [Ceratosolen solmsi marchali]